MSPGMEMHSEVTTNMLGPVRRDGIDQRTVGGHLTLTKRNSTPVTNTMNLGILSGRHNSANNNLNSNNNNNSSSNGSINGGSGGCINGGSGGDHRRLDRCNSEPAKSSGNSSRYKTELCRPFEEHGFCKYGDKCQFAHGGTELRTLSRHPKYKTELCRTFHTIGFCPYGPRCHFIHNAEERRGNPPAIPSPGALPPPLHSPLSTLGSAADSPSPPSSIHGSPNTPSSYLSNSPTSPSAFFDDAFSLFPGCGSRGSGLLEGLTVGLHGLGHLAPASPSPGGSLAGLDTPPVSPVESLAGDLDSLSLSSSSHSASPTPHALTYAHALDLHRSLRLPIFEQLCEHD